MITRHAYDQISKLMKQFPAVGVLGPRQSGKTTLAKQLQKGWKKKSVYFDLESPADRQKFHDPEMFLKQHEDQLVIIDEVQRMPELFPLLRHLIDRKRKPGRFLLLGSASPDMVKGASETLAGRIYYLDVPPFNLTELHDQPLINRHWFRGGFPDALLARNDAQWHSWMNAFVRTYVERDLNFLFGVSFSADVMMRMWRMLAHHHAGIWNAQSFSKGLDISPTTVNRYLDYLSGAFVIRKLPSFHYNSGKRLIKTPKVYLRDSGMLHYLLNIHQAADLKYHPVVGHSWEGYVIEQIIQQLPHHIQAYYYRTHDGSEMDLVLVKGIKPLACIEVKFGNTPSVSRGMLHSLGDLKTKQNFIVVPQQQDSFSIQHHVVVCSLQDMLFNKLPRLIK